MPRLLSDNLNLLWSSLIVAELIKNGLETFFISPGNRNAPLISALVHDGRAVKKICLDERAAGYRALGHAKATGRPGVLVCTSGTAPANYYPSVIEAFRDEIPLVILSADRPPDLVGSDANQTILQPGLFGCYCRESLALPCPSADYPLEALLAKIDTLIVHRNGPVHINCAFRDPLIPGVPDPRPIPDELLAAADRLYRTKGPYTAYPEPATPRCDPGGVSSKIEGTRRGLAVIGRLDAPRDIPALEEFLPKLGWPVFCDIASSMKGRVPPGLQIFDLDHPEAVRLISSYAPETILQFGSGLVSKHYYASLLPQVKAAVIQVSARSGLRDPAHRVAFRIPSPAYAFLEDLPLQENPPQSKSARSQLIECLEALHLALQRETPKETLSFSGIASALQAAVPDGEGLFLGNSLAIRAFDRARAPFPSKVQVISNRGVSGIEGNIATSVGFAEASRRRVTAVIGDISFLHDLNSLLLLSRSDRPVVLIVVNNGGGRIFERLPIWNFKEIMEPYMTTPHRLTFEPAAAQFGLPYFKAGTPAEMAEAYRQALESGHSALLEVMMSPEEDLRIFTILQKVRLE